MEVIATILGVTGALAINYKKRNGFLLWLASDVLFIAIDAGSGLYWQAGLFGLYAGLSVQGYCLWKRAAG